MSSSPLAQLLPAGARLLLLLAAPVGQAFVLPVPSTNSARVGNAAFGAAAVPPSSSSAVVRTGKQLSSLSPERSSALLAAPSKGGFQGFPWKPMGRGKARPGAISRHGSSNALFGVTRLAAVVSGEAEFEQAEEEPSGVLDVEYSETNPAVPAGDDSTEEGVSDTGGQAGRAEGEEERDDEPDPARELAELVMGAVFDWNTDNEVTDSEPPWVDIEEVADETYRLTMEKEKLFRRLKEEEVIKQEYVNTGISEDFVQTGPAGEEAPTRAPYKPEPGTTNIFDNSQGNYDNEEENLEEPNSRTAALARGQQYLYSFQPSQLPQHVQDAVQAADEETRLTAYSSILAALSNQPYIDNINLARQLRWSANVLVPVDEGNPLMVSDKALTAANTMAVKILVNETDGFTKDKKATAAGWCAWLMNSLQNRDDASDTHLPIDELTLGMLFNLESQTAQDDARMRAGARAFRTGLNTEVFLMNISPLLSNHTSDEFAMMASEMGQRTLCLLGEMEPAHIRGYDILREITRKILDFMAAAAFIKTRMELDLEVSDTEKGIAGSSPMTAAEVLQAMVQMAFFLAEPFVYLSTGDGVVSPQSVQKVMDDLWLPTPIHRENPRFFQVYIREAVIAELSDPGGARAIAPCAFEGPNGLVNVGGRLLRGIMGMYRMDAVDSSVVVLADELSAKLFDADGSMPDLKRSWDNLMWILEINDDDFGTEETIEAALKAVVASLAERLIKAGLDKPSKKTTEMCTTLGMSDEAMVEAFSVVGADIFKVALLGFVRKQGEKADGSPTVMFRSDLFSDEELKELSEVAKKIGVSTPTALGVVAKELQISLKNLITRAGRSMKDNSAKDGARIIGEASDLLNGLCTQLVKAFGGKDVVEALSIKGVLPSMDEYWSSELCFQMVDAVRDPIGTQAQKGIPGALMAAPEARWEHDAERILDILGLGDQR